MAESERWRHLLRPCAGLRSEKIITNRHEASMGCDADLSQRGPRELRRGTLCSGVRSGKKPCLAVGKFFI